MNTATVSQAQLLLQYLFALEILDAEAARSNDPRSASESERRAPRVETKEATE